jgi:hypothetical protein
VFVAERVISVRRRGLMQMALASLLLIEMTFDIFVQAVHAKALWKPRPATKGGGEMYHSAGIVTVAAVTAPFVGLSLIWILLGEGGAQLRVDRDVADAFAFAEDPQDTFAGRAGDVVDVERDDLTDPGTDVERHERERLVAR